MLEIIESKEGMTKKNKLHDSVLLKLLVKSSI